MKQLFKRICFREPHSMECPRCRVYMLWDDYQGPRGGWKCPDCGLQIDYK